MSNFAFLEYEWPLLHESAKRVEETANFDTRTSYFYARRTLEMAVVWLFQNDKSLRLPYQPNLNAFIHEPNFRKVVGDTVFTKANILRNLGNPAVHEYRRMIPADGHALLNQIRIPVPPITLQREFVTRLAALSRIRVTVKASLFELDRLFASLQHRAFSGEL